MDLLVRCLEKVKNILPNGGDLMVMNPMVERANKSPTKQIQVVGLRGSLWFMIIPIYLGNITPSIRTTNPIFPRQWRHQKSPSDHITSQLLRAPYATGTETGTAGSRRARRSASALVEPTFHGFSPGKPPEGTNSGIESMGLVYMYPTFTIKKATNIYKYI